MIQVTPRIASPLDGEKGVGDPGDELSFLFGRKHVFGDLYVDEWHGGFCWVGIGGGTRVLPLELIGERWHRAAGDCPGGPYSHHAPQNLVSLSEGWGDEVNSTASRMAVSRTAPIRLVVIHRDRIGIMAETFTGEPRQAATSGSSLITTVFT